MNNMRYVIVLTAAFCLGLIGFGYYLATKTPDYSGPRIVAFSEDYQQRLNKGYWGKGNADAKVVVTEYADFQCPGCRVMYSLINQALSETTDVARFEYHSFPLTQIHNKAILAARAAEAAGMQGKYWPMYEMLYARQLDWAEKTPTAFKSDLVSWAKDSLNLNVDQFRRDLDNPATQDNIDKDTQMANKLEITATPTIYINGKKLETYPKDSAELVAWIREAAK